MGADIKCCGVENERVSLHGGPVGFDYVPWKQLGAVSEATLFSPSELASLPDSSALFRLVSPDGDQGYPGALTVEALVSLVAPTDQSARAPKPGESKQDEYLGTFVYVFRAKVDKDVTPVNLTSVSCFVPYPVLTYF